MATRFRRIRTRKLKSKALKTRRHKHRGGENPFDKLKTFFTPKKTPVSTTVGPSTSANKGFSGQNPMAKPLNERKTNVMLNKIQAELNKWKEQQGNRKPSNQSDPGTP